MSTGTAGKRERGRGSPPSTINTIVRSMGVLLLNKSYYTVHPGPRFFWSDKPTHSLLCCGKKRGVTWLGTPFPVRVFPGRLLRIDAAQLKHLNSVSGLRKPQHESVKGTAAKSKTMAVLSSLAIGIFFFGLLMKHIPVTVSSVWWRQPQPSGVLGTSSNIPHQSRALRWTSLRLLRHRCSKTNPFFT